MASKKRKPDDLAERLRRYRKEIGSRIAALRDAAGKDKDQQWLADRLDVARNTVSQWETGSTTPTADQVIELAAVLGAHGEQILGRTSLDSGLRSGDYVLDLDAQAAILGADRYEDVKPFWKPAQVVYACEVPPHHKVVNTHDFDPIDQRLDEALFRIRKRRTP